MVIIRTKNNEKKDSYRKLMHARTNLKKMVLLRTFFLVLICTVGCSYCKAMPKEDYLGSHLCARCHIEEYNSWSQSAHFNTSNTLEFQKLFQEKGSPENCSYCHATGYKESTGKVIYENIQCESCHIPVGEIENRMYLTPCTNCHSSTQFPTHYESNEYKKEHNHLTVDCIACHDPMGLETNIPEFCICESCHNKDSSYPVDEDHGFDYSCVDCHIVSRVIDATMVTTTHFPIPQDNELECTMCHNTLLEAHKFGEEKCDKCHDSVDPSLFIVGKIPVNETSELCDQCHSNVYSEWILGIHVGTQKNKVCIDCHNPHSPFIIHNETLPPVKINEDCIRAQIIPKPIISPRIFFIAILLAIFFASYFFMIENKF